MKQLTVDKYQKKVYWEKDLLTARKMVPDK